MVMSIGPILPGRIPDSFSALQSSRNIATAQGQLTRLQRQISTGQRFFLPGEDPGAAAQTVRLQSLFERKTQSQRNTEADRSLLSATDQALGTLSNTLVEAHSISLAAIGESSTPAETEQFVTQIEAMLTAAIQTANTEFRGRHLFGGTQTLATPFELGPDGVVYAGDDGAIRSRADLDLLLANNLQPESALGTSVAAATVDLDVGVTAATSLDALNGGVGVDPDGLRLTVGGTTVDVDLSGAETVGDLQTRLQAAFAAGPTTLAVTIGAAGITLTPSAGTVQVENIDGSRLASDLGLAGPAAAAVTSGDLDPTLDPLDPVASLFGGTLPASWTDGLVVTVGQQSATIDLSAATTIEEVINTVKLSGVPVDARISGDGRSLEIVSQTSGAAFSIGENGGTLATDLGLRTLTAATRLDDLNDGLGVPTFPGAVAGTIERDLNLIRRDGTEVAIDLSAATTIQDVLDAINAVDPGVIVAELVPTGNGIQITDNTTVVAPAVPVPFEIVGDAVAESLGLGGQEATGTAPLVGTDTNPQRSEGLFSLLWQLRDAIGAGDDRQISRVSQRLDTEIANFNATRGEVGNRLKVLAETEDRLAGETLQIQESIGNVLDADLTETITQLYAIQASYEASLQISSTLLRTNLVSLL